MTTNIFSYPRRRGRRNHRRLDTNTCRRWKAFRNSFSELKFRGSESAAPERPEQDDRSAAATKQGRRGSRRILRRRITAADRLRLHRIAVSPAIVSKLSWLVSIFSDAYDKFANNLAPAIIGHGMEAINIAVAVDVVMLLGFDLGVYIIGALVLL